MSEYIPRPCRASTTGDGRCIRFLNGNTDCNAANGLFDIRNFRIIRGNCMRKRLMSSTNFAICTIFR